MFQGEHSAILSTCIKLPFVIKSLFCLFLSGGFTHVLLYIYIISLGTHQYAGRSFTQVLQYRYIISLGIYQFAGRISSVKSNFLFCSYSINTYLR